MIYSFPYLLVFALLLIFCFPLTSFLNEKGNVFYDNSVFRELLSFSILLIFLGFRGYIYSDVFSYYGFYSSLPKNLDNSIYDIGWEKGFVLYTAIIKYFNANYTVYQFISVFIDLLLLKKCADIYLTEKYRPFVFLFYYVFYGFIVEVNLLRNIKSILLFFIALQYLGKNFLKYFLLILVACLFHISSIIYIPLYFVLNKKFEKRIILALYIVGLVICLLRINYILAILSRFSGVLPGKISSKVNFYINSKAYNQRYSLGFGFIERLCSFTFIYYFFYIKNYRNLTERETIFFNIAFIYFSIFLYFSELNILVERLPYLFVIGYWVCFPICFSKANKYEKRIFFAYVFLICLIKSYMYGADQLFEYKFIFYDNYMERVHRINEYWGM